MDTFELIHEGIYEKIYLSKKLSLKIEKTLSRCIVVDTTTNRLVAEFVNADDKTINRKIKEMVEV